MSIEGVFRKNGNIRRLKELAEALDKQSNPPSLDDENPVQLAALLKKFLRELPDPLLTSKLQRLWIASQSILYLGIILTSRISKSRFPFKSLASKLLSITEMQSRYHGSCLFIFILGGIIFACR